MASREQTDIDTAQRLLAAWKGLRTGELKVAPHLQRQADEFIAAPLTVLGLVDVTSLSDEAVAFARMAGMGIQVMQSRQEQEAPKLKPMSDAQMDLFALFAKLFAALTGRGVGYVSSDAEIKELMRHRYKHEEETLRNDTNAAADELEAFYRDYASATFKHASTLGGMRLVSGGQRTFGRSALAAVRITGLYADTHLIPDPIYPFFVGDLRLNARHLQLAIALRNVLQLRPLIDAQFPVPPIFVFPSFEEPLEEQDAQTKLGIERLALSVLGPVCDGQIASLEELIEYARTHEDALIDAVLRERLFVPPGADPDQVWQRTEAINTYLSALEGVRSDADLNALRAAPSGVIVLNGVLERLRPQYHLMENASELGAQPLLSQRAHWHYFEKCATATALELRRKEVISSQAFGTLRALQDDSLSWLANISVQQLTELIANNEHRWLREELSKYTTQLANKDGIDPNAMLREVNHGLASLVQRQQKAMNEIQRKYAPKKSAAYVPAAVGLASAASAYMLPFLAPYLAVAVPLAAVVGAVGTGAVGFVKEAVAEATEKRQAQHSMLGILATARARDVAS